MAADIEASTEHVIEQSARNEAVMAFERLTCVGRDTAVVLAREVLCRDFRDRRSIAAFAGLTPSPHFSNPARVADGPVIILAASA
jgi:transposase